MKGDRAVCVLMSLDTETLKGSESVRMKTTESDGGFFPPFFTVIPSAEKVIIKYGTVTWI